MTLEADLSRGTRSQSAPPRVNSIPDVACEPTDAPAPRIAFDSNGRHGDLRKGLPHWQPGRLDIVLDYTARQSLHLPMPLDKASFARKFCWATVKPRAIPNSSYEYMGDGLFRVLFVAAIEKEFGGMTAHDMHVLTGQYLSNPALANIARYFDLFDLMQDCPVENKDAPTIGMLADALEMWLGVMYTEDMRLVGSSKRLSDWVERVFSSRVMPHLALDIEAKRATTEHRGLQLPPRPEYPSEPAWLYAQVESWFPPPLVSSLHLLEKWEHLETECAVILDWHLFGRDVSSRNSYTGASAEERGMVRNDGEYS